MPQATASAALSPNGPQRPNLVVLEGGKRPTVTIPTADHEGLHIELTVSRAERVAFTAQVLGASHAIQRAVAAGRYSLAATWCDQFERAALRERDRAFAVDRGPCPCGCSNEDEAVAA